MKVARLESELADARRQLEFCQRKNAELLVRLKNTVRGGSCRELILAAIPEEGITSVTLSNQLNLPVNFLSAQLDQLRQRGMVEVTETIYRPRGRRMNLYKKTASNETASH